MSRSPAVDEVPRPKTAGSPGLALAMLAALLLALVLSPRGTALQTLVLVLTCCGWLGVCLVLLRTSEEELKTRQERLQRACAEPGSTGLTQAWYRAQGPALAKLGLALGAGVLVLVVLAPALLAVGGSLWRRARRRLSDETLFVGGVFASHFVTFWSLALPFSFADLRRPGALWPYKIQEGFELTPQRFWQSVKVALANQACSLAEIWLVWQVYPSLAPGGLSAELPPLTVVLAQLLASACFAELVFYSFHRLLHTPWWWKHVHHIHHSWKAPTGVSSIYAHPVEHVLGNFLTLLTGPAVLGCHVCVWYVWAVLGTVSFFHGHCGWHFPFLPDAEGHDFHHSEGFDNLGAFGGLMDSVFGTDQTWDGCYQRTLAKTYRSPDYPVDKLLARKAAPPLKRTDARPLGWTWPGLVEVAEALLLAASPPSWDDGAPDKPKDD